MTRLITAHALRRTTSPAPIWTLTAPDKPDCLPLHAYVPGSAHAVPALAGYQGRLCYEKQITCAGTLRILAEAAQPARMLLDGAEIAASDGALHALVEDIDYGRHTLRIETSGEGLIRPVQIEQMGGAYITDMTIRPRQQGRMWLCDVSVTLQSLSDADQPFELELSAGPARTRWEDQTLPARAAVTLKRTVPAPGVKRWSPAQPALYPASCVLWLDGEPADDLRDRFGFRTSEMVGSTPVVNGKPAEGALLRRNEHYGDLGRAIPTELVVRDVQLLRDMGCAAVCTPPDERFLDACDELGLIVLSPAPVGNHPCVVEAPQAAEWALPLFADTDQQSDGLLDRFRQRK